MQSSSCSSSFSKNSMLAPFGRPTATVPTKEEAESPQSLGACCLSSGACPESGRSLLCWLWWTYDLKYKLEATNLERLPDEGASLNRTQLSGSVLNARRCHPRPEIGSWGLPKLPIVAALYTGILARQMAFNSNRKANRPYDYLTCFVWQNNIQHSNNLHHTP